MSDRKKIDLKARLGKKTVSSAGPSIPPPVGIPKPAGIPVPASFGPPSQPARPRIDASDPYAAIAADQAPVRDRPQAIKVEMSQEVVDAQKRGKAKIMALALATAVVGGAIGVAIGGGMERGKRQDTALSGAADLTKEVDAANAEIEKLADVLKRAKAQLADNKYPEKEVSELGGINIPFDGANLTGKGIGLFKRDTVTLLLSFASGATEANEKKDRLVAVLSGSKKGIEDFLSQQTNPKVRWSLFVANGPHGPWATMQLVPEPFLASSKDKVKDKDGSEKAYSWPEKFKIKEGDRTFDLERYTRGEPMGSEPKIIPVDPSSHGAVCPDPVLVRLRSEIGELEDTLRGDKTPGQEKDGLLDTGRILLDKLKEIGGPGA